MFELTGRVALVTGSSRGLGREMAFAFARAGADVIISSRKQDACEATARLIAEETGRSAVPFACHVGRWAEIDALVHAAYSSVGRVDVLVNNAGMAPLYPSLAECSEDLFDKTIAVNLKGPFRLTSMIGTRMAAGDGGSIINISSTGAIHPKPDFIPYSAAKAGLNAMTVGFAQAFGPSVRVNGIMPGAFMTDITRDWDMPAFEAQAARYALGRGGRPDEIVGAALYLASDASSYTTGSIITVDGGSV